MRSISLLLCCLALSIAPALTRYTSDVFRIVEKNYRQVLLGSSILERLHFHSLLGSAWKSANIIYKPVETGDIDYEFLQIMMEVVSKVPEKGNVTIARYMYDFLRNTIGVHEHAKLNFLKRSIDDNYDRMMSKIEKGADKYRSSLNSSDKSPQTQSRQALANFYGRLRKLKVPRKNGHTLNDSIHAVYHFYRGLPTLVELRKQICDIEEVFVFSRETFIRNFEYFHSNLQGMSLNMFMRHSGYHKSVHRYLSYFHGVLDKEVLQELIIMLRGQKTIRDMMQLAMAVVLRPRAYFMTMDDFEHYGMNRYLQLSEKIMKRFNMSRGNGTSIQNKYFLVGGRQGYDNLVALCKKEGGVLAKIENAKDQEAAQEVVKKSEYHVIIDGRRSKDDNSSEFVNNDGKPLPYTNWNTGEPSNDEEECIMMYGPSSRAFGKWNDFHCQNLRTALCEPDPAVPARDPAVQDILTMIQIPDVMYRMCLRSARSMYQFINKTRGRDFFWAAMRLCGSQAHLQRIFIYNVRNFGNLIHELQKTSGLPEDVASLASNILQPGHLYPDSFQYSIKFHLELKGWQEKLLKELDKIKSKSMPKSFIERMEKLIKVITGYPHPVCDKGQK